MKLILALMLITTVAIAQTVSVSPRTNWAWEPLQPGNYEIIAYEVEKRIINDDGTTSSAIVDDAVSPDLSADGKVYWSHTSMKGERFTIRVRAVVVYPTGERVFSLWSDLSDEHRVTVPGKPQNAGRDNGNGGR